MQAASPKRILLVRFSSIGDIVLTFPVVAAIKSLFPNCQVDYVTKAQYEGLLSACPQINMVYTLQGSILQLKKEIDFSQYDAILDLHHNLRSRILLFFLLGKVYRYPKNNLQKWLLTTFKIKPEKPQHVVERYLSTLARFTSSWTPLIGSSTYVVPSAAQIDLQRQFDLMPKTYVTIAIGAQFATKRLPTDLLVELVNEVAFPVLLLGGKEDVSTADEILAAVTKKKVYSAVGLASIHESAWLVQNAKCLITNDTGLMHIGAAFELPLFVIWGNTTPDFGMYPYRPEQENVVHFEVPDLSCRPCSKIGFQSCPKGHFNCMRKHDISSIAAHVNALGA